MPFAVPPKALALAGLLAASFDRPLLRSGLAEALWPDHTDAEARANLRRQLHLLKAGLPDDALLLTNTTAQWNQHSRCSLDVVEFLRLASDARTYADAVLLYDPRFCAGVFDDALTEPRARLETLYLKMLRALVPAALAAGERTEALLYLERLTAADPLDERAAREAMQLRFENGDRTGALLEYHELASRLRSELGIEPERETVELFSRILYATAKSVSPNNLRPVSTSFIGRKHESETVVQALRDRRVVTITGPGGVGKTRLSLHAGMLSLERFPDGVWFVELAGAADLAAIVYAVDQAASLKTGGELPRIVSSLRSKRALLILDNCEHVLSHVKEFVQAILPSTAVSVLATSRRRLEVEGEAAVALSALDVPPADAALSAAALAQYSSVQLFMERAASVAPDLHLSNDNAHSIAEIVRRLDGLPLAIELVAARANLLTPEGLSKRLTDHLSSFRAKTNRERQSTVNAAVAWSYDLLSERERQVLRMASVLENGWTIDALEAIAPDADVFDPLSELVESSLVRTVRTDNDVRYAMFETTRAFALDRLVACAEESVARELHARHFAALADRYGSFSRTAQEAEYFKKCDAEHGNILAALRWACEPVPQLAIGMFDSLWRYWKSRSYVREVNALLSRLLVMPAFAALPSELRGKALFVAGNLEKELANYGAARSHLKAAADAYGPEGDRLVQFDIQYALAVVTFNSGEVLTARDIFASCLAMLDAEADLSRAALAYRSLGSIAHEVGDKDEAVELYTKGLTLFERLNDLHGMAYCSRLLSAIEHERENGDRAVAHSERAIAIYEQLGSNVMLADSHAIFGGVLSEMGRTAEADAAFARCFDLYRDVENPWLLASALSVYMEHLERNGRYVEAAQANGRAAALQRTYGFEVSKRYDLQLEACRHRIRQALGAERAEAIALAAGAKDSEVTTSLS